MHLIFLGHAVLAGSQHYMTFDKCFYEFTGQCSYLLARDFIDGTFSVVVNYHRPSNSYTKKSITVITEEHQFEIFPNSKVLMDGDRQVTNNKKNLNLPIFCLGLLLEK